MRTFIFLVKIICFLINTWFKEFALNRAIKNGDKDKAKKIVDERVKAFGEKFVKYSGTNVTILGKENIPEENCLFVGNHQGYFDIPVMIYASQRTIGFVAKKEMLKVSLIIPWMKAMGCVFLDRQNVREAIKQINEGCNNLKEGYNLSIFPEGTRSKGGEMGEFKKGSLKLAIKSNKPIVPVVIEGTYNIYEKNKKINPSNVTIKFLEPIYIENLSREEVSDLSEIVRKKIYDELQLIK